MALANYLVISHDCRSRLRLWIVIFFDRMCRCLRQHWPYFAPQFVRERQRHSGTLNLEFFPICNSLQTVCEQSATFEGRQRWVQQFVNKVQQIVIFRTRKEGSQTAKNA